MEGWSSGKTLSTKKKNCKCLFLVIFDVKRIDDFYDCKLLHLALYYSKMKKDGKIDISI